MKTLKFIPAKYLPVFALTFYFTGQVFAQTEYPGDSVPARVPDQVMQDVVRRILVRTFKPAPEPKTIDILGSGMSRAWLPNIRNIKFRLVRNAEKGGDIYFFTKPKLSKKTYMIGFGFGDPECGATGDSWSFRMERQKVKLWQNGGFGMGCSGTMGSGTASGSGQPNYLISGVRENILPGTLDFRPFPHKPDDSRAARQ